MVMMKMKKKNWKMMKMKKKRTKKMMMKSLKKETRQELMNQSLVLKLSLMQTGIQSCH